MTSVQNNNSYSNQTNESEANSVHSATEHLHCYKFKDEYDYLDQLLSVGSLEEGDSGIQYKDFDWSWVQPNLIKAGQEFMDQHLHKCMTGMGIGLASSVALRSVTGVVFRTGAIYAHQRHFRSIVAFVNWFRSDLVNNLSSSGTQNIIKTRKLHQSIARRMAKENIPFPDAPVLSESCQKLYEAIRQDLSPETFQPRCQLPEDTLMSYTPSVWFSQLDMVVVLYTIVGYIIAYPEKCGVSKEFIQRPDSCFHGFIHYIGLLGKLFGIADKWNIFLPHHPIDPILGSQRIWTDIFIPINCDLGEIALSAHEQIAKHYSFKFLPTLRVHPFLYVVYNYGMEMKCENIYGTLILRDKIIVRLGNWYLEKIRSDSKLWNRFFCSSVKFGAWILSRIYRD